MYLGFDLWRLKTCGCRENTTFELNATALTAEAVFMACWIEKLAELLFPVLPGSEQLRLQHSRAIEASGPLEWAFLQQSGRFDIGHQPPC